MTLYCPAILFRFCQWSSNESYVIVHARLYTHSFSDRDDRVYVWTVEYIVLYCVTKTVFMPSWICCMAEREHGLLTSRFCSTSCIYSMRGSRVLLVDSTAKATLPNRTSVAHYFTPPCEVVTGDKQRKPGLFSSCVGPTKYLLTRRRCRNALAVHRFPQLVDLSGFLFAETIS